MKDSYFKRTCHMTQLVKQPTHGSSKIDLFYSTLSTFYSEPTHLPGIGLSKHHTLILNQSGKTTIRPKHIYITKRKQNDSNKTILKQNLANVSWNSLYKAKSCQEKYEIFSNTLNVMIDTYLPFSTSKSNNNDHPWVTSKFLSLIKKRQYYFKTGNEVMFKFFRNKVNRERKYLKNRYVTNTVNNLKKENPKQWWKCIKSITGQVTRNESLQNLADDYTNGDVDELAESINITFQNISSHLVPLTPKTNEEYIIPDKYIIGVDEVYKQLSRINVNKSPGPDGIPSWILKEMAYELAPVICSIYNHSFRDSYLPQIWKCANTCALPKTSPPKIIEKDLRPISLTPIISKGIEYYARNWFMEHFKNTIDTTQYGSQKDCSTILALSQLIHEWSIASESKTPVIRILLLDFSKAFDLVDHNILLNKVRNTGAPEFLTSWFYSFLTNRKQRIKIRDKVSSYANIHGGVPQGTLLGPVAFLLHINDLQTSNKSVKYVDDTTIWESCSTEFEKSNIQSSADEVIKWCKNNNMKLNIDKTKEMLIYFGKKDLSFPSIRINNQSLERVRKFKLLGVIINDKLSWGDHVEYICSKTSKRLYFLRLLKRAGISPEDIIQIYCSIIRSVLEYACVIWHPSLTKLQNNKIELIQKRAVKIAYPDMVYEDA
jgi:hypothetical protein